MKNTGMTRKVDELGRIVIPIEIRKNFNIEEGTSIQIFVEGSDIILRKNQVKKCSNCNEIIDDKDKYCKKCGEKQ